jgi:hypothetical protein
VPDITTESVTQNSKLGFCFLEEVGLGQLMLSDFQDTTVAGFPLTPLGHCFSVCFAGFSFPHLPELNI